MRKILYILIFTFAFGTVMAQSASNELVILHTNDTHSQIEPYTSKTDTNVGGFLRREAIIRECRAQHQNVLLLDAGDFSQGTPYFNFFKGYTEVYLMNKMHYDAGCLGNHEFDNGSAALAKRVKKANFPLLCANYVFHDKHLAKVMKPYAVIEKGGLKIGVFGLLVDLQPLVAPAIYSELTYLDPVEAARKMVEVLRAKGCDMIICLSHLGIDEDMVNDYVVAKEVPGIDLIIGGHSHIELQEPVVIGNTKVYQMTNKGKCIGEITIKY